MSGPPSSSGLLVWAEPIHVPFVRAAVAASGLTLRAIGGPTADDASALAREFEVDPEVDRRRALQRDDVTVLWIVSGPALEPEEERVLDQRRIHLLATEPPRFAPDDAVTRWPRFVPRFRDAPGARLAVDALADFGIPHAAAVTCLGTPAEGSLDARLHDALDLLATLGFDPAIVHASADTNRTCISGSLRAADGRGATFLVGAQAGTWSRRAVLTGPTGTMRFGDNDYTWERSDDGPPERETSDLPCDPGALAGREIAQAHDGRDTPEAPTNAVRRLAAAAAIHLSCRTGEAESPEALAALARK